MTYLLLSRDCGVDGYRATDGVEEETYFEAYGLVLYSGCLRERAQWGHSSSCDGRTQNHLQ